MTHTDLVARLVDCWNGKIEDIDNILAPNVIHHETGIETRRVQENCESLPECFSRLSHGGGGYN
jgi:hypothetical protein